MTLLDRFLKYIQIATTSDPSNEATPSTPQQMAFAEVIADDLRSLGLDEVSIDENGYLTATLQSNTSDNIPTIGFIAHLDTSPDMSGEQIVPQIITNYDGEDIVLNKNENIILSPIKFPELKDYKNQTIIATSGNTLLGADDKAGIVEILSAMEFFIQNPQIKHGKIRVAFTPDEEIGRGANKFDVKAFGCEFAYTIDGGQIGEIEYENFNAASAEITFYGTNVHPGYAKGKMLNSIRLANEFINILPKDETPETTEEYEGFFHLTTMEGTVEKTTISYIIRDHDREKFENRKKLLIHNTEYLQQKYGSHTTKIEIKDSYYNMREKILPSIHIVETAIEAIKMSGIEPIVRPIRGGTDGATLSFKGLPCPNIFTGGHNFHSRYEFVPLESMEKAVDTIKNIITIIAK